MRAWKNVLLHNKLINGKSDCTGDDDTCVQVPDKRSGRLPSHNAGIIASWLLILKFEYLLLKGSQPPRLRLEPKLRS